MGRAPRARTEAEERLSMWVKKRLKIRLMVEAKERDMQQRELMEEILEQYFHNKNQRIVDATCEAV